MSETSLAGIELSDQFAALAKRRHCVWLDTAAGEGKSLLAADPFKVIHAKGTRTEIDGRVVSGHPFDILKAELACQTGPGVAVGYFGYDLKNQLEKLSAHAPDDVGLPDLWFGFYAAPTNLHLKHNDPCSENVNSGGRDWGAPRARFTAAVRRAKEYIAAGDIYQVNLSQRFQTTTAASAPQVYRALRDANPAPYCAYLDIGTAQILSSSPECFLKIDGRHVVTRPIKGTRPRASDPAELLASPKDNAELLMITDLERNDLGRVCEFGSVHVPELVRVETYATVHHLVATVAGTLRPDVSHVDCIRACFPGGSITGAPKIRAMQIISELEGTTRGPYAGCVGYFSFNGNCDTAITIRTALVKDGKVFVQAGGGWVTDSDPEAEFQETVNKSKAMRKAVALAETFARR